MRRGHRVARVLLAVALLAAAGTGCATNASLELARDAERSQDFDRAVVEYTKAVRERPNDRKARAQLETARLRASQYHFDRGRRSDSLGQYEAALIEFQLAAELNPRNGDADRAVREIRSKLRAKVAVNTDGTTRLETLIAQARNQAPPGLDVPQGRPLPGSVVFRDASSRDAFTTIARLAEVSLAFDPSFRDVPITIELQNASLEEALKALAAGTRTFFRVTGGNVITVIPDTPAKRREYEEEIIRTFYLGNADVKETIDLLRIVVDNRRISPITATNAITIKDTPERITAAAKVISAIDKARAELVIDVELLEVDRRRMREYGLQVASPGSAGIDGAIDINREGMTLNDLRNLTSSNVFLTGIPALYYRLIKSDSDTRTLANPQLRTSEGLAAQARFGERVPVPVTVFAPIATGGVNQQPITSFNYENIGVNIDITPRIHHNEDVSLTLKIEVSNVSGTGYGGLPTFGNRAITTTIRLKDGETNMLAGLIRDEDRRTLDGVPGLSDLPVIGRLFAANHVESIETDVVLMVTPHIIRVLDLKAEDLAAFRVGREGGSSAIVEFPSTAPGEPPGEPGTPPVPRPGQVSPVRPPKPPGS